MPSGRSTTRGPANVNRNSFGKLFAFGVGGAQCAQPLYIPNDSANGGSRERA